MSILLLLDNKPEIDVEALQKWPRYGMSIASLLVCSKHNLEAVVEKFQGCGVQLTRINLLSALWPEVDTLPYTKLENGIWNLYTWNPAYFDRLVEIRERMNQAGIVVQWTNYELYSWSNRKPGPQQIMTPWRHNINGINWKADDSTFNVLPDQWSKDWFRKVVPYLDLKVNVFEIGNEFPEKILHEKVLTEITQIDPNSLIQVNRNEDTPGQYKNMKIGRLYDFIAFHGNRLKEVEDLDRKYPREPEFKTFNEFFKKCPHEPRRIVFSSDGARISNDPVYTYNYPKLQEFAREMKRRGCSYEHQSRAKMTPPPNHHMIEDTWFAETFK